MSAAPFMTSTCNGAVRTDIVKYDGSFSKELSTISTLAFSYAMTQKPPELFTKLELVTERSTFVASMREKTYMLSTLTSLNEAVMSPVVRANTAPPIASNVTLSSMMDMSPAESKLEPRMK